MNFEEFKEAFKCYLTRTCEWCGHEFLLKTPDTNPICPVCGRYYVKKVCPKCGKAYEGDKVESFCPDCGTEFSATSVICKKCNKENDVKFKYCTKCGSKLK